VKSTSSKSLSLTFFLLSLIIHIQIIWQLSVIEKNEPHTVNNGFLISLSHKKTVLPPEAAVLADQPIEPLELIETEVLKPQSDSIDELIHKIDTYNEEDRFESDNQDLNAEPILDYGDIQNVVQNKESAKKSFDRDIIVSNSDKAVVSNSSQGDSDDELLDASKSKDDNQNLGFDELDLESIGLTELGVESLEILPEQADLDIPKELLGNLGNMALLEEKDLGNVFVQDPFSANSSKKLKLINPILERLYGQVTAQWVDPFPTQKPKTSNIQEGSIIVQLTLDGFLINAYVYRSSGYYVWDYSWLDAVRAVKQWKLPKDPRIAAIYTTLSLRISSNDKETELMPYEKKLIARPN
jgi:hypothetical protein